MKNKTLMSILICFGIWSCNQPKAAETTAVSQTEFETEEKEEVRPKTPEELREELRLKEESAPSEYLDVEASWEENMVQVKEEGFFSDAEYAQDGYNVTGQIQNNASVALFKDAVLQISYLSQTRSVLSSQTFTIYQFISPNHSAEFNFKVNPPKQAVAFDIEVAGATPIEPELD